VQSESIPNRVERRFLPLLLRFPVVSSSVFWFIIVIRRIVLSLFFFCVCDCSFSLLLYPLLLFKCCKCGLRFEETQTG
jgi:hypothetical protein